MYWPRFHHRRCRCRCRCRPCCTAVAVETVLYNQRLNECRSCNTKTMKPSYKISRASHRVYINISFHMNKKKIGSFYFHLFSIIFWRCSFSNVPITYVCRNHCLFVFLGVLDFYSENEQKWAVASTACLSQPQHTIMCLLSFFLPIWSKKSFMASKSCL